jgi:hypothetical protein
MIHVRQDFRMNDDSRTAYLTLIIYSEAYHTRIAAILWQKIPASSITTVLSIPSIFVKFFDQVIRCLAGGSSRPIHAKIKIRSSTVISEL